MSFSISWVKPIATSRLGMRSANALSDWCAAALRPATAITWKSAPGNASTRSTMLGKSPTPAPPAAIRTTLRAASSPESRYVGIARKLGRIGLREGRHHGECR